MSTERSDPYMMVRGVVQGSLIGPILFILYMNDVPSCIREGDLVLYADDTTHLVRCSGRRDADERVEMATGRLRSWFDRNDLAMNEEKTAVVHFFTTRREAIETTTARFLGFTLDSHLNLTPPCRGFRKEVNSRSRCN